MVEIICRPYKGVDPSKIPPRAAITLRLPPWLMTRLRRLAKQRGVPLNVLIQRHLEEHFDN